MSKGDFYVLKEPIPQLYFLKCRTLSHIPPKTFAISLLPFSKALQWRADDNAATVNADYR